MPKLTPARVEALRALADGEWHDCWKYRTGNTGSGGISGGPIRVNNNAAWNLGPLAQLDFSRATAFVAGRARITDAGREALAALDT